MLLSSAHLIIVYNLMRVNGTFHGKSQVGFKVLKLSTIQLVLMKLQHACFMLLFLYFILFYSFLRVNGTKQTYMFFTQMDDGDLRYMEFSIFSRL